MKLTKKNRFFIFALSVVLTTASLWVIFRNLDFNDFYSDLKNAKLKFIFYSLLAFIGTYFFRALRFYVVLRKGKLLHLISISGLHYFINKVIPARIGEFSLPFLLSRYLNIRLMNGMNVLFIVRLFDLFAVWLVLIISSLLLENLFQFNSVLYISIPVSFALFYLLLFHGYKGFEIVLQKLLVFRQNNIARKIVALLLRFRKVLKQFSKGLTFRIFFELLATSIGCWFFTALFFFLCAHSISLDFTFGSVLLATSISALSVILPLSTFGNIGTFEAGWVGAMVLVGIQGQLALKLAFFSNVLLIAFTFLLALVAYSILLTRRKSNTG